MIRKTEKLLITFHTTTDAMAMERLCKAQSIPGRLVPVPGAISADCGLGWCAGLEAEEGLRNFLRQEGLHFQGIHRCLI